MEYTMMQEVMTEPGKIEFQRIAIPKISSKQVLLKIMYIGICGSDIHVYHGTHAFTKYPVTQGHEVSGQIVEIGSEVTQFSIGQKVTIEPQMVCGECHPCRHGKYNLCENLKVMGFQATGAASTYFAVDADKVTLLDQNMSYEDGAMIEPLAVAVHSIRRVGDVNGLNVAVIGAGPIGNLVAQTAKGLGARKVLISDVSDFRLDLALKCGVDMACNTRTQDFGEAMITAFGQDKADVIYDCAGNDETIGMAIKNARKGSTIILVAVYAGIAKVDLAVLNDHELDLNTTMMYRHEDYLKAIQLVTGKKIELKMLQSRKFLFFQYLDAYKYIDANRETTMKVLIDVQNQKREDSFTE